MTSKTIQFRLKAGQRLFVNGAVLRVDRKVAIEFLNDVTFLLDSHVIDADQATTPLRQLYFVIQLIMMDPTSDANMQPVLEQVYRDVTEAFENEQVKLGLQSLRPLLDQRRYFDALKILRRLFPIEEEVMNDKVAIVQPIAQAAATQKELICK